MLTGRCLGVQTSDAAPNAAIRAVTVGSSLPNRRVRIVDCERWNRKHLVLCEYFSEGGLGLILHSLVHLAQEFGGAALTSAEQQILQRLGACCGARRGESTSSS